MLVARTKLGSAMFVLADFGRYPIEIANLEKGVGGGRMEAGVEEEEDRENGEEREERCI